MRIAVIPWVHGSRGPWKGDGYTAARIKWTVDRFVTSNPHIPVVVVTPHVELAEALAPASVIDCGEFLKKRGLVECGVMTAMFHPDLCYFDIIGITADAAVIGNTDAAMPTSDWWAAQQHLGAARPYGDWFSLYPVGHKIRRATFDHFIGNPHHQVKFDRWMLDVANRAGLRPSLMKPPVTINAEWIMEGWKPWCDFAIDESTVAVHPHSHTKWPELASRHESLSCLHAIFDRPVPKADWPVISLPSRLSP